MNKILEMEILAAIGFSIPVLFVVLLWTSDHKRLLQAWLNCLSMALLCELVFCSALAWGLKDGLGSDSIQSQGIAASQKFLILTWPIFLFAVTMWLLGVYGAIRSARRIRDKNKGSQNSGSPLPCQSTFIQR